MMALKEKPAIPAPNLVDRAVEYFAPGFARKRMLSRVLLAHTRAAYLAASPSDPWSPRRSNASADADHLADAPRLRGKSRSLYQNVGYVRAGVSARAGLMVGSGIVPKFGGKHGKKLQELWNAMAASKDYGLDADGATTIYGRQHSAAVTSDVDGELLIRVRPRRPADGLLVPIQFQFLEVDWLDTTRTRNDENGNDILSGKEYNAIGKCVAYWLWDQHPGDPLATRGSRARGGVSSRVPAEYILHVFSPERPGAGRGFPRLAPIINDVRDLQLLQDAHAQRKNLEARLGVLATASLESLENPEKNGATPVGSSLGELAGGGITYVGSGMDLTAFTPQPDGGFPEYLKLSLHVICAGMGATFEQCTGILTDTNFSSARVGLLNQRKEIEHLQWHMLVPSVCDPICEKFAQAAALSGRLGPDVAQVVRGVDYTLEHSTPKWDYLDPKKEVDATIAEIGSGLTSFSESIRRRGDDPDIRVPELVEDIQKFKAAGIWEEILTLMTGSRSNQAAENAANTKPKEGKTA